jgi:dipeptidyl aminopeptidase/acylaminoacyl peptidase
MIGAAQKKQWNHSEIGRCVSLFLILQVVSAFLAAMPVLAESHRRFTVRDSIELSRFVDPNPFLQGETPIPRELFSPDGKQVVMITERGNLATNQVEDTMWLFDVEALRKCAGETGSSPCPSPRSLLHLSGTTTVLDNQDGMISQLGWLNSKTLRFLGRNGSSTWHLYTLDVPTASLHQLTPDDQNVSQFQMSGDLILYTAAEPYHPPPTPEVVVATGRTLYSLLFADEIAPLWSNRDQLWLTRNGKTLPLIDPKTEKQVMINRNFNGTPKDVLSVSPDGRHAVVNIAITSFPSSWEKYVPGYFSYQLKPIPHQLVQYAYADDVPERYVLVDLETGATTVMLDAPLGRGVGYFALPKGEQVGAAWSKDSRRVLLANAFQPIGVNNAESAPAILSYDLSSQKWAYVAPFKEDKNGKWALTNAAWGEGEREVVLQYSDGGPATEIYRLRDGEWKLVDQSVDKQVAKAEAPDPPVDLSIRQDLNSPPMLFVGSGQAAKAIWDPAPQLKEFDLGEVTPYRWRDKKGREVKGLLFKPPDFVPGKRYPLVIEPRMYSEHAFITDGIHVTAGAARAWTAAGVLVLEAGEPIDIFTLAGGREWFRSGMFGAIGGYEAAIKKLVSDGLVDGKRVGIFGFSRTCWNVVYALTQKPHLFAAATISDGITYSYFQYLQGVDMNDVIEQEMAPYGAQPVGKGLRKWFEQAPDFNLDRVNVPLRMESHMPGGLLQDWGTYSALRMLNRPVDIIMLPNASHVVSMPLDILESQQGNVDWFRFWLQDYEDPDPAKAEQYKRWEGLRQLRDHPTIPVTQ